MLRPIRIFAIATLVPVALLALGATLGGLWAWLALGYLGLFVLAMDRLVAGALPEAAPGQEFPAADGLSVLLALAHFALLPLAVWAVSGASGQDWPARIALFFGFGLFFGQISNSNAHELIHRSRAGLFRLGMWVYVTLLFGHHTSAHRLVHHRHVATRQDPNSARAGESFYAFARRAWIGSFRAGLAAEGRLRAGGMARGPHPYLIYTLGAGLCLALAVAAFGWNGGLSYLLLAAYAQMQLLLSDYVQHYGLRRAVDDTGRAEPVSERHSWNAEPWFSGALMLNAPRHSAHHAHPGWQWPGLPLPPASVAPRLPYSLPVMGAIALVPRRWFRLMDPRLARWREAPGRPARQ